MDFRFAWFLIPIVAIIGGSVTAIITTMARARVREAEIRERIALIERGLVPPPEVDPAGFDRAADRFDRHDRLRRYSPGRGRRAGIILMGLGFGLMVLISFSWDSPAQGIGTGGFLVVLGLAFFVNSLFDHSSRSTWNPPPSVPPLPPTSSSSAPEPR